MGLENSRHFDLAREQIAGRPVYLFPCSPAIMVISQRLEAVNRLLHRLTGVQARGVGGNRSTGFGGGGNPSSLYGLSPSGLDRADDQGTPAGPLDPGDQDARRPAGKSAGRAGVHGNARSLKKAIPNGRQHGSRRSASDAPDTWPRSPAAAAVAPHSGGLPGGCRAGSE